ncbi:MAG TPA: BrnT family toxin [Acidobacteriota bacterium]|nr:BrnT family toxin [Acidobacteriota bacterium]
MDFEWDPAKARANESKHGVSFFEASQVFGDDHSSSFRDPDHSIGESRFLIFGLSRRGRHMVVSYAERDDRIRLISARKMTPRERRVYEQRRRHP